VTAYICATGGNISSLGGIQNFTGFYNLVMEAKTGIGSLPGTPIASGVPRLAATTNSGDIYIKESGSGTGLEINSFTVLDAKSNPRTVSGVSITAGALGDDIVITAASPMNILAPVTVTGGGDITLAAEGSLVTDDMSIGADITATGGDGNINLYAGHDIIHFAGTVSAANAGNVSLFAGKDYNAGAPIAGNAAGSIKQTAGTLITSAAGDINLYAANNVFVADVTAPVGDVDITAGDKTVTGSVTGVSLGDGVADVTAGKTITVLAGGNILLEGDTPTVDLTATNWFIFYMGLSGNPLDVTQAMAANGDVTIGTDHDLTISGLVTAGGWVELLSNEQMFVNANVTGWGVELTSYHDGSVGPAITLAADVKATSAGGNIYLTAGDAAGDILQKSGIIDAQGAVTVTANDVTLEGAGINADGTGTAIKITATGNVVTDGDDDDSPTLTATAGSIVIDPVNVTIGAAVTAAVDVAITASKNITLNAVIRPIRIKTMRAPYG